MSFEDAATPKAPPVIILSADRQGRQDVDFSRVPQQLAVLQEKLSDLFNRYMTAIDTVAGLMAEQQTGKPGLFGAAADKPYEFPFDPFDHLHIEAELQAQKATGMQQIQRGATDSLGSIELTQEQYHDLTCQNLFGMLVRLQDISLPEDFVEPARPEVIGIPVVAQHTDPLQRAFVQAAQDLSAGLLATCTADYAILAEHMAEAEYSGRLKVELPVQHDEIMRTREALHENIASAQYFHQCLGHFLRCGAPRATMH